MTQSEIEAASQRDDESDINLFDLVETVFENLRLLVLGPLAIGILALAVSFFITPLFTASAVIMPPQQQQSGALALLQNLGAVGGAAGSIAGLKNPNDQFVSMIQSRSVEDALINKFKLIERYEKEFYWEAREKLEGRTVVKSGKDGLIAISVEDEDPKFAAVLANAYITEFSDLLARLAITEAQQRRQFFEKQLEGAKDGLVKAERALQASGVDAATLKANPSSAVSTIASLQASITAQEVKVASMRGYLADQSPELRQSITHLSVLRAQLARAEKDQGAKPPGDSDYIASFREFKYRETLYELLAKQYEIAKIDEAKESAAVQVVDSAVAPERKSYPKKAKIAVLATLLSGFALLVFVFVRKAVRTARLDPNNSQRFAHLTDLARRAVSRG